MSNGKTDYDFQPKLEAIDVPLDDLLLDPNNPRFLTCETDRVGEANVDKPGEQTRAFNRMRGKDGRDQFDVRSIAESIDRNGWQPVDEIFVRKLDGQDKYVVLEGNRRLTALRLLREDNKAWNRISSTVDPLAVKLVDEQASDLRKKASYLLGVRHHGSLLNWSPFAQAHNIYARYLRIANQLDSYFSWDESHGEDVAKELSIPCPKVKERIKTYRVMKQIEEALPTLDLEIEDGGGVKGHHYTLVSDLLKRPKKSSLHQKFPVDPASFLLSDNLELLNSLCHFHLKERGQKGEALEAPVSNPREWRPLEKILADEDEEARGCNFARVHVGKEKPSQVWAERHAELTKPRWDLCKYSANHVYRT